MAVFSDVDELKDKIVASDPEQFFEECVVSECTDQFGVERVDFVANVLSREYSVDVSRDDLVVVGSSKIGFALHDKIKKGEVIAPAFRPYGADSDIDLSICSASLFKLLWHEISEFACRQKYIPYEYKKLGSYLTYGWLRQDHFPRQGDARLIRCDNLLTCRGRVRRDRSLGHPKVDFGIFYSIEHLKFYQARSIRLCKQKLESPL